MKAEKINVQLETQKILSQFGTTEMASYRIQKLCEAYAKDQIEKDRERVKLNVNIKKESCPINNNYLSELYTINIESIDNTPIILD